MSQKYEWYEDMKSIRIKIPIKGVSMKKIDIYMSDLVLKVNVAEIKMVKLLDLKEKIDFESTENHFVYIDQQLECTIIKQQPGLWNTLLETELSKTDLNTRRQESFQRKEKLDAEKQEKLKSIKIKHDSFSVTEQMRIENIERKKIEELKEKEKKEAVENIYKDINNEGKIKKTQSNNQSLDYSKFDKIKDSDSEPSVHDKSLSDSNSSTDQDDKEIFDFQEIELPSVRSSSTVNLKLTEKVFPHLAARETHAMHQPMPKAQQQIAGQSQEEYNPVYLKEKGDGFYQNKDYYSAINAYSQALKLDSNNVLCLMNKSAVNLCLFNFDEVLRDTDHVIHLLLERQQVLQKTEMSLDSTSQKILFKAYLRQAIVQSWKGNFDISLQILTKMQEDRLLEQIFRELQQPFDQVKQKVVERQNQINKKKEGDIYYRNAQLQKAKQIYESALSEDSSNEIILSNLSIVNLKLSEYSLCIQHCDLALQRIENLTKHSYFNSGVIGSSAFVIPLKSKLLLRKAKALYQTAGKEEANSLVKQILENDEKNQEAKEFQRVLENEKNREEVEKMKQSAADHMVKEEIQQALVIYQDCLKKISLNKIEDIIAYCSILLNKSVCHLKNDELDDIISCCVRGIKIIKNYKNRVISFQKTDKSLKEKLLNFELRFLVRRGNAYLKQGQLYNALNDLEEAEKLDPRNQQIKDDIQKIKQQTKQHS